MKLLSSMSNIFSHSKVKVAGIWHIITQIYTIPAGIPLFNMVVHRSLQHYNIPSTLFPRFVFDGRHLQVTCIIITDVVAEIEAILAAPDIKNNY